MTPDEFRFALYDLGLSQAGASRFLGVDERTARRWSCGDTEIPESVARFLRYIIATGATPDKVTAALAQPRD